MKIKIDTELKVIQVEQQCKLIELFDFVKNIFPDNKWKDYSIEAVPMIINWNNPWYVPYDPYKQFWYGMFPTISDYNGNTLCIQTN